MSVLKLGMWPRRRLPHSPAKQLSMMLLGIFALLEGAPRWFEATLCVFSLSVVLHGCLAVVLTQQLQRMHTGVGYIASLKAKRHVEVAGDHGGTAAVSKSFLEEAASGSGGSAGASSRLQRCVRIVNIISSRLRRILGSQALIVGMVVPSWGYYAPWAHMFKAE